MIALVLALIAAVSGGDMISRDTWRVRAALDQLEDYGSAKDRFVDMGVVIRVVRANDEGNEYIPGAPKLEVISEHRFGGMVDTRSRPSVFVGPSVKPVVWYLGEAQRDVVLHGSELPNRLLVYGAMGAGKTQAMARWIGLRALQLTGTGAQIGATAPTTERVGMIKDAITLCFPESWYTWSERRQTFTLTNGVSIKLVGTHQSSAAEGSRIQGYNWAACASDEIQDSLSVDSDIEARGRSAPRGKYMRFASATAKDSDKWRSHVAFLRTSGKWGIHRIAGLENPFVFASYWQDLRRTMTDRDYRRKVLAQDVGPERQTYHTYSRDTNVRPVPLIGATDVTRSVLAAHGLRGDLLVGHDPGATVNASVMLKAYQAKSDRTHRWYAVGEYTTRNATSEVHAIGLRNKVMPLVGGDLSRVVVVCDPHTERETSGSPHTSVYHVFRQNGFAIIPAAGKGFVPREARIEMVCTLLRSADGNSRLFVACDDRQQPLCPDLVRSLELSSRDESGRADAEKKGTTADLSHWSSALGYALWRIERPALASWGAHGSA